MYVQIFWSLQNQNCWWHKCLILGRLPNDYEMLYFQQQTWISNPWMIDITITNYQIYHPLLSCSAKHKFDLKISREFGKLRIRLGFSFFSLSKSCPFSMQSQKFPAMCLHLRWHYWICKDNLNLLWYFTWIYLGMILKTTHIILSLHCLNISVNNI